MVKVAIDAIYYKIGNFNQIGLEFPTFIKSLVKVYYPKKNKVRFEQPNVNNINLSMNQLKQIVDTILPINFNALTNVNTTNFSNPISTQVRPSSTPKIAHLHNN